MPPSASIVFPTRHRRQYLAVALASVSPQAREHGAEIVVIEDEAPDAPTQALAEQHGAIYIALGAARGINVARNAGIEAASGDLICFLDDDVEVWPGWLAALLDGARACPDHDCFGGPIRPRLENVRRRTCGREAPPVTALDLGPADRDAELVWGANLAVRRRAIERYGLFDPALNYCGDEEDWEHRLRAAGRRIRYLARAGVDHRRAGSDARTRNLSRAAWYRGYHARRYDERKQTAPSLGRELRVLGGCLWHTARYRCVNGIPLTAMSAGRIKALVEDKAAEVIRAGKPAGAGDRGPSEAADTGPDFLSGQSGTLSRRTAARGRLKDGVADVLSAPTRRGLRRAARLHPRRRVLAIGVARPENAEVVAAIRRELAASHHAVDTFLRPGAAGAGKWQNLNRALTTHPLGDYDWLLLIDDDVRLPRGFLDSFLLCSERFGFALVQPAHAYCSHAAWPMLRRRPQLVARSMRFVEIGPVTAVAAAAFDDLLPFPDLRMGWGLDCHWSAVAAELGHRLGVVDATPVRHLRPVAAGYDHAGAVQEARDFLRNRPYVDRSRALEVVERYRGWAA
ncbi:MAG: glycosyltransferase [Actinomycetota bacterium]|nr:glycosyltransferase [Actinomycetota bacterium]